MKIDWKLKSRFITPALSLLFAGFFLFSCNSSSDSLSLLSSLDKVDTYIRLGQTEDALKLLKKASKHSYSAYARLGIYKRFITLGEKTLAEKTLLKAIKKIPDNAELKAVYSHFLLRENRISEALKYSSSLSGTNYGSLYSESVLKLNNEKNLLSPAMSEVYRDSYNATGNGKWLVNAALPFLKNGDYATAASFQDKIEGNENNFWAQVHYDAGNYDLCIENLEYEKKNGITDNNVTLASDAYVMLGDYDSAERERAELISLSTLEYGVEPSDLTYVNSAIWSYNAKYYERAYTLLLHVVMNNSKSVPALLTYGKFAVLDLQKDEEDLFEKALRKTKLRSYSMEQKDSRPKFLIEDALFRIEQVLEEQKNKSASQYDELLVEKLSLWLKQNEDYPQAKKEAEIWKTLELNEIGSNMYPPLLVNFCVSYLLKSGKENDARTLFTSYLDSRYKLKGENDSEEKVVYDIFGGQKKYTAPVVPEFVIRAAFGDRAADYAHSMEIWEIEMSAYFSLRDKNIDAAKRLYEYVLFETGGVKSLQKQNQIIAFSSLADVASAVNLASIYSSTGELQKAQSLYGLASGRTRNKKLKSKILYRTALIQKDMQNMNGAILSLDYAISLDPENADARLLKKQIK